MKNLLGNDKYSYVNEEDKAFIIALDDAVVGLGYAHNGIEDHAENDGFEIRYYRTGLKTRKYCVKSYFRGGVFTFRMLFTNIDRHREYIENAPDFIKQPFVNAKSVCKRGTFSGCIGQRSDKCSYKKTYTIDSILHEKCSYGTFVFDNPCIENIPRYMELLTTFFPGQKRIK